MQRVPTLFSFSARGAARVLGARLKSTGRGSRAPGSASAGADLSSSPGCLLRKQFRICSYEFSIEYANSSSASSSGRKPPLRRRALVLTRQHTRAYGAGEEGMQTVEQHLSVEKIRDFFKAGQNSELRTMRDGAVVNTLQECSRIWARECWRAPFRILQAAGRYQGTALWKRLPQMLRISCRCLDHG